MANVQEYLITPPSTGQPDNAWIEALVKNDPKAEFAACYLLNPATGKPGIRWMYAPDGMGFCVPVYSKAAPEAMQYLEWLHDPANYVIYKYGFEGIQYTLDKSGVMTNIPLKNQGGTNPGWPGEYGITLYNQDPDYNRWYANLFKDLTTGLAKRMWDQYFAIANNPERKYFTYVFLEPLESVAKYSATLGMKINELYVQSIMAKSGQFDAVFDRLVNEYLNMGGQEVIDEKLKLYKKYNP
jgi:putative aldouronate transport system substrate-binding protein